MFAGIEVYSSPDNTIGGTAAGSGNVSSGNGGAGIVLNFDATVRTVVAGNLIGVGADGHTPLGNSFFGVDLTNGANANTIGGTASGAGNVIVNNLKAGVVLFGGAPINGGPLSNNVVAGNLIGVLSSGAKAGNSGPGVEILGTLGPATHNTIGGTAAGARNVISANTGDGIDITDTGASLNAIAGNYIGTDSTGETAIGNLGDGVHIVNALSNVVGGDSTLGFGNVISGNAGNGVFVDPPLQIHGALIQGNLIGLDATGAHALANLASGVFLENAASNTVGGLSAGLGNTIGGNAGAGVDISGVGSIKNLVIANLIGTNGAGASGLGNLTDGVRIESGATGDTIGGVATGAGNLISGNTNPGYGVDLDNVNDNVVQGNVIGLDANGAVLGNYEGVLDEGTGNTIGGGASGAGNVISGSLFADLVLSGSVDSKIQGNQIGTDATGTLARTNPNQGYVFTVRIFGASTGNVFGTDGDGVNDATEGNVVAVHSLGSSNGFGIYVDGVGTESNVFAGNFIGTDPTGTLSLSSGPGIGIYITGGARANRIGTNSDGVSDALERNVISANSAIGIALVGSDGNTIAGNYVGVDTAGTAANGDGTGVVLQDSPNNTVGGTSSGAGNVISGNTNYGVSIDGSSSGNVLLGNLIGTDASGLALPSGQVQGIGVYVVPESPALFPTGNTIGGVVAGSRNVISGNSLSGVTLAPGGVANVVAGNYIGTDITGEAALGNGHSIGNGYGILDSGSADIIGGSVFGATNVVSGNKWVGIAETGSNATIAGNYVGTDATGSSALPNQGAGVYLTGATGATIGGTAVPAKNVISGNLGAGVYLTNGSSGVSIEGNYIGTDQSGTMPVGNAGAGIDFEFGSSGVQNANTIGGAARNVIAANQGGGVVLGTPSAGSGIAAPNAFTKTAIRNNLIGTDVFGTGQLGNTGFGVSIGGGTGTSVGGTNAGQGNTIAFNTAGSATVSGGVIVAPGLANGTTVVGNFMRDNAGLGIDLDNDGHSIGGVPQYHAGVDDPGVTIAKVTSGASSSAISGVISGGGGTVYAVDLYSVASSDPTGHGEGGKYLGRTFTTGNPGDTAFSAVLPFSLAGHQVITATITDAAGNTSEFAPNFGGNNPPTAVAGPALVGYEGTAVTFDGSGSSDPDGDPLTYQWDFHYDGNPADFVVEGTGVNPSTTYTVAGSYAVALKVSDSYGGTSFTTTSVTINNVAPSFATTGLMAPAFWHSIAGYGTSVAVAGDEILAIASPTEDQVYLIDPTTNALLATLKDPSHSAASGFGDEIAAVGFELAVGAPHDATTGADDGAAYLFDADPQSPTFGHLIKTLSNPANPGDVGDHFGASLAAVGTNDVAVGAPGFLSGGNRTGGVFVYDATQVVLASPEAPVLSVSDPDGKAGDAFGSSIAAYGSDIVTGAPSARNGAGAAWVIDGATGQPVGSALTDPNPVIGQGHQFGQSVAVVGTTIAVSAPFASNGQAFGNGAVYLFGGSPLALKATLIDPEPGTGQFGSSLATTSSTLLVGSPKGTLGDVPAGAAYEYDADSTSTTFGKLLLAIQAPTPSAGDGFGSSVAFLDNDVIVGAPGSATAYFYPTGASLTLSASTVTETPGGFDTVVLSGQVSDPGTGESHAVVIDWQDGTQAAPDLQTINLAAGLARFSASHRYAQDIQGAIGITATATDSLGASSPQATAALGVNNAPPVLATPTVTTNGDTEGSTVMLSDTFTDLGQLDAHTVTIHWADGSQDYSFPLAPGVTSFSAGQDPNLVHTYPDNPASGDVFPLTITVADDGGGSDVKAVPVTIQNVAPTLSAISLGQTAYNEGDFAHLSGVISDPGVQDSHDVTIDWGDGSTPTTVHLAAGVTSFDATTDPGFSHQYLDNVPGQDVSDFTVHVSAVDKDHAAALGATDIAVTVANVAPVVKVGEDPSLTYPATNPAAATEIFLQANVTDPGPSDAASFRYAWAVFDQDGIPIPVFQLDGTTPADSSSSSIEFAKSLSQSKSGSFAYHVTLAVTDDGGPLSNAGAADTLLIAATQKAGEGPGTGSGPITVTDAELQGLGGRTQVEVFGFGLSSVIDASGVSVPVLIDGGDRADTLIGGTGDDTLVSGHGPGINDLLVGGQGDNVFEVQIGSSPTLDNNGSNPAAVNTVDVSRTTFGVDINLGTVGLPQVVDPSGDTLTLEGNPFRGLVGTQFADVLRADDAGDLIQGGGGGDLLFGGAGNDTLVSGSGPGQSSSLFGGSGSELLFGGAGKDTLAAGSFSPTGAYTPVSGNSTLVSGSGGGLLYGGSGNDSIVASSGSGSVSKPTTLAGNGGSDILYGGSGPSTVAAGSFNPPSPGLPSGSYNPGAGKSTIIGGSGPSLLYGGSGQTTVVSGSTGTPSSPGNTLVGGFGHDLLFAGAGKDTVAAGSFSPTGAYTPNPMGSTLVGGSGGGLLYGGSGNDSIVASSGSGSVSKPTTLAGNGGSDILYGGSGPSTVAAGSFNPPSPGLPSGSYNPSTGGNTTLVGGSGPAVLYGGVGNDSIVSNSGPSGGNTVSGYGGSDLLYAGSGNDTVASGSFGPTGQFVPGTGGHSTLVGGTGQDLLYGGSSGDTLVSGSAPSSPGHPSGNTLIGGGGPSVLYAAGGDDSLVGGDGSSLLYGGSGNSTLAAGSYSPGGVFTPTSGPATLIAGSGNSSLVGGSGGGLLYGGTGNSTLVSNTGSGRPGATLVGGFGNDLLFAGHGPDTLQGGSGNTTLHGGPGGGLLYGGSGNSTIHSGSMGGNNPGSTLVSGSGSSLMFAGSGNDTVAAGVFDPTGAFHPATNPSTIVGGSGSQLLYGGAGDDSIVAGDGPDNTMAGNGGNDLLFGGAGHTTVAAGSFGPGGTFTPASGNPTLVGGSGQAVQYGGLGNALILGALGGGSIFGGAGDDLIFANAPDVLIQGGLGNDTLTGGFTGDTLDGGQGTNWAVESRPLSYTVTDGSIVGTNAANQVIVSDTIENIQKVAVTGADTGTVLDASDYSGDASLIGGGADTLIGGTGHDILSSSGGSNTLIAGSGDTTFAFTGSTQGTNTIEHGAKIGTNTLDFSGLLGAVNLDLQTAGTQDVSPSTGLVLVLPDANTFRQVIGTNYDDFIVGNSLDDTLIGGGGDDELVGRGGDNTLIGGGVQLVYLDFNTFADVPGLHVYTQDERDRIQSRLTAIYSAFSYTFTQTQPASGPYSSIVFDDPKLSGLEGGISDAIDWRNLDHNDVSSINVNGLLGHAGQPAATSDDFVALTITVSAHELGHLSGLEHADSFGPIGSGIYANVDPNSIEDILTGDPLDPTIAGYPGPANAVGTPMDILASGASVHNTLFDAIGETFFGERDDIKLAYSQEGSPAVETSADHNELGNGQALAMTPLATPNTVEIGSAVDQSFDVTAADVIGHLGLNAQGQLENDFYTIQGQAGEVLNVNVYSAALSRSRFPNFIDGVLRVYYTDPTTHQQVLVPYYGSVAENDNGFQSFDPTIIDLVLPTTGTYTVEVSGNAPADDPAAGTGDYELFLYSFALGQSQAKGDSLFGGSGDNTVVGDTGNGVIEGSTGKDVVQPGSGDTTVVASVPPQFVTSGDDRTVAIGTTVSLTGSFFDPDETSPDTFLWHVSANNGEAFADGTSQGFSFLADRPGKYTVTFSVSDGPETSSSTTVVTVNALPASVVAPSSAEVHASEGTDTVIPVGSISDSSPFDGPWTISVNWGDQTAPDVFTVDQIGALPDQHHSYANNLPNQEDYTVTVSVLSFGATQPGPHGVTTFPVAVKNLPPVVSSLTGATLSLSPSSAEYTATGSFADVSGDSQWTGTVNYGDGTITQDLTSFINQANQTFSLDHVYTQASPSGHPFAVVVTITDKDGGQSTPATAQVVVNSPLSVTAPSPEVSTFEGVSTSIPLGSFSDANSADGPWTVTVHWNDGTPDSTFPESTPGSLGAVNHTFANLLPNQADYQVTLTVADKNGHATPASVVTFPVAVKNLPPVVTIVGGNAALPLPSPTYSATGSFADASGDGPWTGTVDFGDGSGVQSLSASINQATRTFSLSHTYAQAGPFTVTVKIKDALGAESTVVQSPSSQVLVTVYTPVQALSLAAAVPNFTMTAEGSVVVTFNGPIDPNSFTPSSLSLNGVSLAGKGVTILPVAAQPTMYTIGNLSGLNSAEGSFSLVLDATQVRDMGGHPGVGSASTSWIVDKTKPTSKVGALPQRGTGLSFAVTVTGTDAGASASGVASYDIYVEPSGSSSYSLWMNVPASTPTATFTGQSNTTYSFYSIAHDRAGNVETKTPIIEASTYLPDLSPPVTTINLSTAATNPSTLNSSTATFTVNETISDVGGSGLKFVNVYVSIDGAAQQQVGFPIAAGAPDQAGLYHTTITYQGLADGHAHSYRFSGQGTDGAGNVEPLHVGADDPGFDNKTFAVPSQLQMTSFSVEHGAAGRSYVRYLDLGFNETGPVLQALAASPQDFVLTKFDLTGANPTVVSHSGAKLSAIDHAIEIDFGAAGIGANANTTAADGYYELDVYPLGQGVNLPVSVHHFDRLFGDVNGDGTVDANDLTLIAAAIGQTTAADTTPLARRRERRRDRLEHRSDPREPLEGPSVEIGLAPRLRTRSPSHHRR